MIDHRQFAPYLLAVLLGSAGLSSAESPEPQDFIEFDQIQSVALSPAGDEVFVRTRRADLQDNEMVTRDWWVRTDGGRDPQRIELPAGARSVGWHPDGDRLIMLAQPDPQTPPQVMVGSPDEGFESLTRANAPVVDFELGSDGDTLVYTTMQRRPLRPSRGAEDRQGVEIDVERFALRRLLAGQLDQPAMERRRQLWVQESDPDSARQIAGNRSVMGFALDPAGDRLALTATDEAQESGPQSQGADLLVLNLETGRMEQIREGVDGADGRAFEGRVSHSSPSWSPSGTRLLFLRTRYNDWPASVADLGVHDFENEKTRFPVQSSDRELGARRIHWENNDTLLVERVHEARRGLYRMTLGDGELIPVRQADETYRTFSFGNEGQRAAWVEESTQRPPEVYFGNPAAAGARKLTAFNRRQNNLDLPSAEVVSWTSVDGTDVSGWLLEPKDASAGDPAPLLVFLAGGPGLVVENQFSLYPRRMWPFPLSQFVSEGYALLVVHYRGTESFGREFQEFTLGRGGVDDVRSGINAISERAEIDGDRLGILGQSHGAALGPLVADDKIRFDAASFAEGLGSTLTTYLALEGWRNLDIHEQMLGASPWEDPEIYQASSPVFNRDLIEHTPTLIEAGEHASVIEAVMLAKALWRSGTEHELVVYPDSGHNIRKPALMLESMERNLDWFDEQLGD